LLARTQEVAMKTLIVYDSAYGNTEQIARAVGHAVGDEVRVALAGEVDAGDLKDYELVIVGSPTQGGRPTPLVKAFLQRIPAGSLKDTGVTAFDTRIDSAAQGFMLRTFMGALGYAAGRIARQLESKGGRLVTQPKGFFVEDKEGPLRSGEIERASAWGATIVQASATIGR
jgi:flavodoxin